MANPTMGGWIEKKMMNAEVRQALAIGCLSRSKLSINFSS